MRTLLLSCCLLFGTLSVAYAQQGLRVSVHNDIQEPLPHAYIYINERAVAVTDTLGWAMIPQDKIRIGDTISVSYVATENKSVIFDIDIREKGEYQFILTEIYAALRSDEVVVNADIDIKKLYRQYVRPRRPFGGLSLWRGDFSMNVSRPKYGVQTVDGKLKIAKMSHYFIRRTLNPDTKLLNSLYKSRFSATTFLHDLPVEITTSDDTIGLSHNLQDFTRQALSSNNEVLRRVNRPAPNNRMKEKYPEIKVNYSYLGKDQDHRIFRLTYSEHGTDTIYQILVKADIESREVLETTINYLDLKNGDNYYIKSKIRDTTIWNVWNVPSELEYRIRHNNGTRVNLTMSNIDLRGIYSENHRKYFSRSPRAPRLPTARSGNPTKSMKAENTAHSDHNDIFYASKDRIPENFVKRAFLTGRLE